MLISNAMLKLEIQTLRDDIIPPQRMTKGSSGIDLYLPEDITLDPGRTQEVGTGVKFIIPEGYFVMMKERSSVASQHGVSILGGVIDSGK